MNNNDVIRYIATIVKIVTHEKGWKETKGKRTEEISNFVPN